VASTISEACQLDPIVKLPNDVYVNGRKVAGVLVEMKAQPRTPHLAILGVGLNVNESIGDFPPELRERATSLAIATGRKFDRDQLAIELLRNLDRTYRAVATPQLRP
jgi:BirA family biotin operon repressor/biotin-[acetyl-CoA-carboxylase] ligase